MSVNSRETQGSLERRPVESRPTPGRPWRQEALARLTVAWILLLPIQVQVLGAGGERDINVAPSDLVLAVALLIALGEFRFRRGVWSPWHFALPGLILFNLLAFGVFTNYALLNKSAGILILVAAYTMLTTVGTTIDEIRRLVRTFVSGVGLLNLASLAMYFGGVRIPSVGCADPCLRFQGMLPDPNLHGSLLVVALAFVLTNVGGDRHFLSRRFDWLLHTGLLLGLVLTLSRSAWLSGFAVIIGAAVFRRSDVLKWLALGASVITGLVLMLAGDRLSELVSIAERRGTIDSRFKLVDQGLELFITAPMTGIGLGQFPAIHGQIIHNTALWFAVELGLIGLLVFVGFLGWNGRRALIAVRVAPPGVRALTQALILGHLAMLTFSLSVEAMYQRHWWLLFALTASSYAAIRRAASPPDMQRS